MGGDEGGHRAVHDLDAVLFHRPHRHQVLPIGREIDHRGGRGGGHRRRGGLLLFGIAGQDQGIDAVGLGEAALAAGEGMSPGGIEYRRRVARRGERGGHPAMVAAGGFEGDRDRRRAAEAAQQRLPAAGRIGDPGRGRAGQDRDIEVRLADIDPDEAGGVVQGPA